MSHGVRITRSTENPERYRCDNYDDCHTSSSHDPSYVGWWKIHPAGWACTLKCKTAVILRRTADSL